VLIAITYEVYVLHKIRYVVYLLELVYT